MPRADIALEQFLGAASGFAQTAGNIMDKARREEADALVAKYRSVIDGKLADAKSRLMRKQPDGTYLGVEKWEEEWAKGSYIDQDGTQKSIWEKIKDMNSDRTAQVLGLQGVTAVEDGDDPESLIDSIQNPYAKQALRQYYDQTREAYRQSFQEKKDLYLRHNAIVTEQETVTNLLKAERDAEGNPMTLQMKATAVEESLARLGNLITDPADLAKIRAGYMDALITDALMDAGNAAKKAALDAGKNPLAAIRDVDAAIDKVESFTFMGKPVNLTPEEREKFKKAFATDLKEEHSLREEERRIATRDFETLFKGELLNPAWNNLSGYKNQATGEYQVGLYTLRNFLSGKPTKEQIPPELQASLKSYMDKYGITSTGLLADVEARINELERETEGSGGGSGSDASKWTIDMYKSAVMSAIANGGKSDEVERVIAYGRQYPHLASAYESMEKYWRTIKNDQLQENPTYKGVIATLGKIGNVGDRDSAIAAFTIGAADILQRMKIHETQGPGKGGLSPQEGAKAMETLGTEVKARTYGRSVKDVIKLWQSGEMGLFGGEDQWEAFHGTEAASMNDYVRQRTLEYAVEQFGLNEKDVELTTRGDMTVFITKTPKGKAELVPWVNERGQVGFMVTETTMGGTHQRFQPYTGKGKEQTAAIRQKVEEEAADAAQLQAVKDRIKALSTSKTRP